MRPEGEELNTPAVVTAGIVAAVLLFVAIVFLQAYFATAQREESERQAGSQRSAELDTVQTGQQKQLRGYRWVDRTRGIVAIPIEQAMQLVTGELPARAAAPARPTAANGNTETGGP